MQETYKRIFIYLDLFLRHKWLILTTTVIFAFLAGGLSLVMTKHYRSTTMILVEHQKIPESYVKSTDKTPIESRLRTIKQQILSRTRLYPIIKEFKLYGNAEQEAQTGPLAYLKRFYHPQKDVVSVEKSVESMRGDIKIKVIGGRGSGGDAFSITYIGKSPYTTMAVTNKLTSLFIDENLKIREQAVESTTNFLGNELSIAKKQLKEQERELRRFKERHMGSLPEQLDANLKTLDRLQLAFETIGASIKTTQERERFLTEQIERMKMMSSRSTDGIMSPMPGTDMSVSDPLIVELAKLKRKQTQLLSIHKANYPDVILNKSRIARLENLLKRSQGADKNETVVTVNDSSDIKSTKAYADLMSVRTQLENLQKRRADIMAQTNLFEKRVESIPANEQKMADVKRGYDISLKNYQSLLEKKFNAELAKNLEKKQKGEKFKILDPANLPERPFKPQKIKITLLGMLLGAAMGAGLVIVMDGLNPVFRKADDFAGILPYAVIGQISDFKMAGKGPTGKFGEV